MIKLASALLLLVAFVAASDNTASPPTVNIKNGQIVGETIELKNSQYVHRFLGVPYAQPPVGKLRFRRPRPLEEKWSEPLMATKWPKKCMQDVNHPWNSGSGEGFEYNHEVSEDCLFLNVWTPSINADEDKLRPVVMWIHGGALFMGTSAMFLYDGQSLANMADAVVVTINYRLSTLGFLYSDQVDDIKGNQGLWDQAMALEWIQDNIRYFGGDPNAVTIIGESAGGWSVSAHLLSPVSRNLYHNAFMMSGAIDNRVAKKPDEMVKWFLKGIRKVGCASEQETSISHQVMECIEKLDPTQIDQIVHQMYDEKMMFPPMLTVDGEFFTDYPFEMLKKGDYKTNVNLIADSVENEGSFMFQHYDQFHPDHPTPITLDQAKSFIAKLFNEQILEKKMCEKTLSKVYFNGLHPLDDPDRFRDRATIAYGDLILNCPTLNFAKAIKKYSPEKANVFQMFYRVHIGQPKFLCSKWSSACHTDDIFSVFGLPFSMPDWFVDREREVATEIIGFFSEFIRTGKPNTKIPQWQEYFFLEDKTLVAPYYEITNRARTHKSFKFNLKQAECQLINNHIN